jgi:low affinity Fe/Cu permease
VDEALARALTLAGTVGASSRSWLPSRASPSGRVVSRVARIDAVTSPYAPLLALALIGVALFFLPPLGFSRERIEDVHFLVAVATLLLVFLLEHNEDRDKTALHIKLDEILGALHDADRGKVGVEDLAAKQLREIRDEERETVRSRR